MKTCLAGLLLILLAAGIPFQLEANSFDSQISSQNKLSFVTDSEKHLNFEPSGNDKLIAVSSSNFEEYSNQDLALISSYTSALLFRDNLQTKPVYWLKTEINPPDLRYRTLPQDRFSKNEFPWFLLSNHKTGSRLSGWKDSNLLYTANITYY